MTNIPRMRRRSFTVLIGALVAVLLFAGTAVGVLVTFSGGTDLATQARSQTSQTNTSSQSFSTLLGSSLTYSVPSGGRFFDARSTGESLCSGTANNICIVRVVARNTATGAIVELHPRASSDFAFDQVSSSGNDLNEAHAMERFVRLSSGSWTFSVQIRVSNVNSTFSIDDWSFVVDERQ
jgi:hypothetical protein